MSDGRIRRTYWCNTNDTIADGLTKSTIPRDALVEMSMEGKWTIRGKGRVLDRT